MRVNGCPRIRERPINVGSLLDPLPRANPGMTYQEATSAMAEVCVKGKIASGKRRPRGPGARRGASPYLHASRSYCGRWRRGLLADEPRGPRQTDDGALRSSPEGSRAPGFSLSRRDDLAAGGAVAQSTAPDPPQGWSRSRLPACTTLEVARSAPVRSNRHG